MLCKFQADHYVRIVSETLSEQRDFNIRIITLIIMNGMFTFPRRVPLIFCDVIMYRMNDITRCCLNEQPITQTGMELINCLGQYLKHSFSDETFNNYSEANKVRTIEFTRQSVYTHIIEGRKQRENVRIKRTGST